MVYMYTFIVTNMDSSPEYLIKFYCKRGLMENFIKESKSGFDFASVSSHTRIVNANRLQLHALAYNIFNWFRRLVLSANMCKQRIDTVRLKLLKIAATVFGIRLVPNKAKIADVTTLTECLGANKIRVG